MAADEVLAPASPDPHILVAFNAPSLAKFGPHVRPNGYVLYDSTVIHEVPPLAAGVRCVGVPFTGIARELGKVMVKNVVALGALQAVTGLFPADTLLTTLRGALKERAAMIPLNEEAFRLGGEKGRT